jgi:hypothetical protein
MYTWDLCLWLICGVGDLMGDNGILAEILENLQRFTHSVSKIQNFKLRAVKI